MAGGRAYRRRLRGFAAAVALFALAPTGAAWAVDVPVRAATHRDFGRMVFDWPAKVGYSAAVEGDTLVVRFDQPLNAPVDRAVSALPDYLSGVRLGPDGKSVVFDLKRPVAVKSFLSGTAVAIDLTPAKDAPKAEAAKPEAAKPEPAKPEGAKPDAPKVAPAGGRVAVRGFDDATHSRLEFTWPTEANHTLRRDGAAVTLLFDHEGALNLAPVDRAKLRNIRNVEAYRQPDGALAVTFAAPPDAEIKDSRSGRTIVVDVENSGTRKGGGNAAALPAEPPKPTGKPPEKTAEAPAAKPPAPPAGQAQPPAMPPVTVPNRAAAPAPAMPAAAGTAAQSAAQSAMPGAAQGPSLVFDPGGPSSVAVYPRAGRLYIVFDKPMPIGAGKIVGGDPETLGPIEPVPATGGTAFRTKIGPMLWPTVSRRGTAWTIAPSTVPLTANPFELPIVPEPDFLLGARLVVRAPDAATVVTLSDPEVGDRLQVVPLPMPGNAIPRDHRFADLELLPTFQGVVVRPIADSVSIRPVKEGVELTKAGGLHLSPVADTGNPVPAPTRTADAAAARPPAPGMAMPAPGDESKPPAQGQRLFNLPAWKKGDLEHYTEARQDLQLAIVNAPESERPKAQLDLARFYFAHGFGQETLGMLDVLQSNQPDLEGWPEFRALRGAARELAGDTDGAAADLGDPVLANNGEAGLWRAAIAADRNDWPAAEAGFKAAAPILATYPDPILTKMAVKASEAALETRDTAFAKRLLNRVIERGSADAETRPDIQYLRGLYFAQIGEPDRAREQLTAAYNSLDRFYRAKAGLALANLELAEGRMSPSAAAEMLAGLTFTWRGDDLELQIRQRMGEVLIAAGKYAEGFNALKETAALAANTPRAERITQSMSQTFADLFKDGAKRLSTLDALQLYDQFRELTPVGEAGDEVIRQLAERLISVDLLNRAADLLQHQVEYRLSGLEKAKIGTRLASVRLLDNKPEEAIKALELSNVPGIPADLAAERKLMQAKALAEMGQGDQAMQLLADDDSNPANLLRIDIAWKAQKWDAAALALGKVIGPPPAAGKPVDPQTSQMVLNRAVALALAGDGTGLNLLRKDFGTAMTAGPDSDAFRVLTRPEQALGLIDVNTIRQRVAEVDLFQKFLKDYRGKQSAATVN